MAAATTPCDHGYSTVLEDGSDPYKESMNVCMRHILDTNIISVTGPMPQDLVNAIIGPFGGATLARKLTATGLRMLGNKQQRLDALSSFQVKTIRLILMIELVISDCSNFASTESVQNMFSEEKLKLYFYERAPCRCFVELAEKLKRATHYEHCRNPKCRKKVPVNEMFECSRCATTAYCCKNCQLVDWKRHKQLCKVMRKCEDAAIGCIEKVAAAAAAKHN